MKKQFLNIFICILILLIGINAVNALDNNCTDTINQIDDEYNVSCENNDDITLKKNNEDNNVLSIAKNNQSDVLSIENKDQKTLNNNDQNNKLTALYNYRENNTLVQVETKKISLYKWKIHNKYWKYFFKSEKKLPKKIKKMFKKEYKKMEKSGHKKAIKLVNGHWNFNENSVNYKITKKGKYRIINYYIMCSRTYYYDLETNLGWWSV